MNSYEKEYTSADFGYEGLFEGVWEVSEEDAQYNVEPEDTVPEDLLTNGSQTDTSMEMDGELPVLEKPADKGSPSDGVLDLDLGIDVENESLATETDTFEKSEHGNPAFQPFRETLSEFEMLAKAGLCDFEWILHVLTGMHQY